MMLFCLVMICLCYRKMYWTDQGTESGIPAKVASADMDGSNAAILFTHNLEHVEFITIDLRENKLYWAVTGTGVVWQSETLISSKLGIYWGKICVPYQSWVDMTKNTVKTAILWNINTILNNWVLFKCILTCNLFLCCKAEFSPVFSDTRSFRNHSNMQIWKFRRIAFIWNLL